MIEKLRHLFVHELLSNKKYFFAKMQKIVQEWKKDEMLNLLMLRLFDETKMIELSKIMNKRMYMLSVTEKDEKDNRRLRLEKDDVLFVNWSFLIM